MFCAVVGSIAASSQDDMQVRITPSPDNSSQTMGVDAHESMRMARRPDSIYCDTDAACRCVLKANREGRSACQLSMQLRLGRSSADSSPRDSIGEELRTVLQVVSLWYRRSYAKSPLTRWYQAIRSQRQRLHL